MPPKPLSKKLLSATIPFTREQLTKLEDLQIRVERVRELLNAANFDGCDSASEVAEARQIIRNIDEEFLILYLQLYLYFRDGKPREAATK
jgi:hypothetical protein